MNIWKEILEITMAAKTICRIENQFLLSVNTNEEFARLLSCETSLRTPNEKASFRVFIPDVLEIVKLKKQEQIIIKRSWPVSKLSSTQIAIFEAVSRPHDVRVSVAQRTSELIVKLSHGNTTVGSVSLNPGRPASLGNSLAISGIRTG